MSRRKSGTGTITLNCDYCNKEFVRSKCHIERREHNFCSQACRIDFFRTEMITLKCAICGKEFTKPHYKIKKVKYGEHYCSISCSHKGSIERAKVEIKCDYCGRLIIRKKSRIGKLKHAFCSQSCCGKWKASHLIKEASPTWKGGKYTTYDGYIKLYKPEHPDSDKSGYINEHRLVIEQIISRRLKKTEVVHHLNGVRDDNRPENLIVTTRKQHESNTLIRLYVKRIKELEKQLEVMKNKQFENSRTVREGERGFIQDSFTKNDGIYPTYPHTQTSGLPIFKA